MNRTRITDPIFIGTASSTRMTGGKVDPGTIPVKRSKVTGIAVTGARSQGKRASGRIKGRHRKVNG